MGAFTDACLFHNSVANTGESTIDSFTTNWKV